MASGLGVFEAAAEAGEPGEVWAIGVDCDQYNLVEPELQPYILTSMLKKVDVAVYETIKAFAEGNFAAGAQVFDLAADGVGYSTTGGFVDDIAAELDGLHGADHRRRDRGADDSLTHRVTDHVTCDARPARRAPPSFRPCDARVAVC